MPQRIRRLSDLLTPPPGRTSRVCPPCPPATQLWCASAPSCCRSATPSRLPTCMCLPPPFPLHRPRLACLVPHCLFRGRTQQAWPHPAAAVRPRAACLPARAAGACPRGPVLRPQASPGRRTWLRVATGGRGRVIASSVLHGSQHWPCDLACDAPHRVSSKACLACLSAPPGCSWLLTWFAHDVPSLPQTARLFDLFLSSHPLMPLYVAAVVIKASGKLRGRAGPARVRPCALREPVDPSPCPPPSFF